MQGEEDAESPRGGGGRRWGLLRLLISAVLIGLLLAWVDWRQVTSGWLHADARLLLLSALVLLGSNLAGGVQWWLLLRAAAVEITLPAALRAYFVGLFFNNFLPSGMGGDAVKVYDVGWRSRRAGEVLAATVCDRLLGLVVLTTIAVVALLVADLGGQLGRSALLVWLFFGLLLVAIALLLHPIGLRLAERVGRLLPGQAVVVHGLGLLARVRGLLARPGLMLQVVSVSVVVQFSRVMVHVLTGAALGLNLSLAVYATVVPVLGVLINLPSINGVGIREGGGVLLFAEAGVSPEMAVSMQLLTYVVMVLLSLIGGVLFAAGRRR
jgi:uncharacterized membrane protein YbhN (UPF0104 family)